MNNGKVYKETLKTYISLMTYHYNKSYTNYFEGKDGLVARNRVHNRHADSDKSLLELYLKHNRIRYVSQLNDDC